jgi:hypothetical protein
MNQQTDSQLDAHVLAAVDTLEPLELLRRDLEDCLKEYSGIDLIVEILQNAIDAMDDQRYQDICNAASLDPMADSTINLWNKVVMDLIEEDYNNYVSKETAIQRGEYYRNALDFDTRRTKWWEKLGEAFESDPDNLRNASTSYEPRLKIRVRLGSPAWIEVEDYGTGIDNIIDALKHKSSSKRFSRASKNRKRIGIRGSHGWGLSAVLAMSDRVEILTRQAGSNAHAFAFIDYSDFVTGEINSPVNKSLDLTNPPNHLSVRLVGDESSQGTHVRICIDDLSPTNPLGHTLINYNHKKFCNFLRMYTPVGQVNDYLLHPAFHVLRKGDLEVEVESISETGFSTSSKIDFDIFRYAESAPAFPSADFTSYLNSGWPSSTSVHTVHRYKSGTGEIYLVGAEIQDARELAREAESLLEDRDELPGRLDDDGIEDLSIQRGYHYAVSGGMKAEYLVKPPKSTTAAFRGFVLSETAEPTLGRKYVLDQRNAIVKAAGSHENLYDDVRRSVLPDSAPPVSSPAAARWRREFFVGVREDADKSAPASNSLATWAGSESREAMVMLMFSELVQLGAFGDLRILRAHLKDKYDFAFLYQGNVAKDRGPNSVMTRKLSNNGWTKTDKEGNFQRYGIGEFKIEGDIVFDDFDPDEPRKSSNAIDLLVCWSFDAETVEDMDWIVEPVNQNNREFQGQTHVWRPGGKRYKRPRNLAVASLIDLVKSMKDKGELEPEPSNWPSPLPEVYF